MNRISEITKRDIQKMFKNGMEIVELWDPKKVTYPYHGELDEIDFLKRIYNLEDMISEDPRYSNAEEDIWQHTKNNDDYADCWVFEDDRFQLMNGDDRNYLRFICEIFHPAVRYEGGYWKEFLNEINKLLKYDGYELYVIDQISNRDIYDWKLYKQENEIFIPFSERYKKTIKQKQLPLKIQKEVRRKIHHLLLQYDYSERKSVEGYQYNELLSESFFNEIRKFYIPKCFKENNYVETNSLEDFVLSTSPHCVIDVVEFFDRNNNDSFMKEINLIFELNDFSLKLNNGKIETKLEGPFVKTSYNLIDEVGLQELLEEAHRYYEKENFRIATEKLWDAFERLKTYYSPQLDKKKSANKIISEISGEKEHFIEMFKKEFNDLTVIGNNFRIRHHETTKVDISDDRHYEYFYKRCLSLLTTVFQYLYNKKII